MLLLRIWLSLGWIEPRGLHLLIQDLVASHATPEGARTLSPNLTPVTAFKRGAGLMKREAQQLSGGPLTQFIIIKLRQYYERSPAFIAVFNVDG
jgi:hypothetical protein